MPDITLVDLDIIAISLSDIFIILTSHVAVTFAKPRDRDQEITRYDVDPDQSVHETSLTQDLSPTNRAF